GGDPGDRLGGDGVDLPRAARRGPLREAPDRGPPEVGPRGGAAAPGGAGPLAVAAREGRAGFRPAPAAGPGRGGPGPRGADRPRGRRAARGPGPAARRGDRLAGPRRPPSGAILVGPGTGTPDGGLRRRSGPIRPGGRRRDDPRPSPVGPVRDPGGRRR